MRNLIFTILFLIGNTAHAQLGIDDVTVKNNLTFGVGILDDQSSTPANPSAGYFKLYFKTDGVLYRLNSSGSEAVVSTPAAAATQSYQIENLAIATSVGANAITISLKNKAGNDPSGGDPVTIGFRSSTITSGVYTTRTSTAATSVTVSSGSTLGQRSAVSERTYVYAIDNAGTIELAVSSKLFEEYSLVSTTAEGGAGAADSRDVMYSTTARSNVPFRLIGHFFSTQATAGTWATSPSAISVFSQATNPMLTSSTGPLRTATAYIANSGTPTITRQDGNWISSLTDNGVGDTTVNIVAGVFSTIPNCQCTAISNTLARTCQVRTTTPLSTTAIRFNTTTGGGSTQDVDFMIVCTGGM